MAQTIDIKVAIDAASSVKTIKEAKAALKDLRSAALQVEEGTQAFFDVQQAAGQLKDKIADLNSTTKYFADDLRKLNGIKGILEGIAGGFAVAQGAAALFGGENSNLEKTLVRLNSIMAILNGLTALGNVLQKESSAVLFIQNGLRTSLTAVVGRQAVAEAAEAVAAGTATVAQRALNAAMNANPVGILITLILAGVAALYAYTSATEGASEAEKQAEEQKKKLEEASRAKAEADEKEREKVGELSRGYFDLIIKLKQTDAGTKERQATLEKINKEYGTTLKNIKDESKFQDQLNASVKEYIALQVLKIRQQNQQKEEEKAIGRLVKAQDDLNKLVAEYAGKSKQEIEDYDQKTYGVSVYSDSLTKSKLALKAAEGEAEKYAITSNKLQAEVDKLSLKFNKTETEVKTNTKSIKENQKSISNLADAYAELIKLTNEYNLQSTTAYLERVKTSLSEEVQLRQIAFDEKIKQEEENLNKVLKKVYDEEAKELQNKKEFTKKKNETDEQYTKRLEDEIKYRLKNDKNYADKAKQIDDAKAEYAKAVEAKKQVFIQETNQYILEQQQKQQEAAKKVASEILSPAQFEIFFKSVGRLTEKYVNIYETDLGKINDETKKLLMKSYGKAPEIDLRSFNNLVKNLTLIYQDNLAKTNITLSKDLTDGLLNSLKTGGKEVYSALNELQNSAYNISLEGTNKSLSIIRDLFGLGTDYLNGSIDDNTAYTLKIAALYQDKYQVIQDIEKSTYDALTKTQRSFFDATEAQIVAQIDFIKNNKLLDRKRFEEGAAGEEEYNKALRKAAIERLKFTTEDNEKLSSSLEKRYNTLIEAAQNFYSEELGLLLDNNNKGLISDADFLKSVENLRKKHNDNLIDIDVAYGKKSFDEIINRRQAQIEKQTELDKKEAENRIAVQQKLNSQLLSLEQQLQNAIFELLQRSRQRQEAIAQSNYDAEIDRINRAQKAYENSVSNRTAAQQAEIDAQAGFDEQRKNAEDRLNQEKNFIAQKAFTAEKINNLATITQQTAVAVAKTIAELGGLGAITPPGALLIAAVIAQGAIQAGLVASQKFVPQFATGGLVSGPGSGTSDNILVKVSNGESIINAKSTKMYRPVLSAINQAGGGKPIGSSFAEGGMVNYDATGGNDMKQIKELLIALNERPIETYVKQTVVENAASTSTRLRKRTTFG